MKRLIAYITSIATLLLSFNTAVFAAEKPTATVSTTTYSAYELKGNYTYDATNAVSEGVSEFEWYTSDEPFGEYKKITGATKQTLKYDQYEGGKYVKFVVIPVDTNGTKGDHVEANPVQISKAVLNTFDNAASITDKIEVQRVDSGEYGVKPDPKDSTNNAFWLYRPEAKADDQTRIAYLFDTATKPIGAIVDMKVYIDDLTGTWEMAHPFDSSNNRPFRMYVKGTTLTLKGASTKSIKDFAHDTWHTIRIVLDFSTHKIKEVLVDGTLFEGSTDLAFESNKASNVKNLRTYMSNKDGKGTCYIDDLSITNVFNTTGYAKTDAEAISINTLVDFDVNSVVLPQAGSTNKSTIVWDSSNKEIIKVENGNAVITRPSNPTQNEKVTLTAHVINGNDYYSKEFEVDVICIKTASLDEITSPVDGSTVTENFTLQTQLFDGTPVTWTSSDSNVIEIDGANAIVRRYYTDKSVTLTASATILETLQKREFNLTVLKDENVNYKPPVASNVKIEQYSTTYITGTYDFVDQGGFREENSIYKWYVEGATGYEPITGEENKIFVPSKDYDGKNIRFSVTPASEIGAVADEEFMSDPYKYTYYTPRLPVAKIDNETGVTATENGEFVLKYSYTSDDYVDEGATEIVWSKSATLFGTYEPIQGATGTTYVPTDHDAYYKVSVTPVDEFGTKGETVEKGPFLFADVSVNTVLAADEAVAALSVVDKAYGNIKLPTSVSNNVSKITWESDNPSLISADGAVTRPSKEEHNTTVKLTAHVYCGFEYRKISFNVTVMKYTEKPVISELSLRQEPGKKPIHIDYVYTDADGDKEGNTIYEWYYKSTEEGSTYKKIEGANLKLYAPKGDTNKGGYTFYAKITPVDNTKTVGDTYTTPEIEYTLAEPAKPTAIMNPTQYKAFELIGNYEYQNPDSIPEGKSEYKWFISDSFFGPYEEIAGETGISLKYTNYQSGKYVKFAVIPKDIDDVTGEMFVANPVLISSQFVDGFETDASLTSINASSFGAGSGFHGIADNPAPDSTNSTDKVYKIQRVVNETDSTSTLRNSILQYNIPKYINAAGLIIDLDICVPVPPKGGNWEAIYIMGSGIVFKMYVNTSNKLYYQSVTTSPIQSATGYIAGKWNHIRIVLDMEQQLVKEIVVNNEVQASKDMPFRSSVSTIDLIRTYFQGAPTGTGYLDNIAVTPILKTENYAYVDVNNIKLDIEADSVISDFRLPVVGSEKGSAISWEVDNKDVILVDGNMAIVKRPSSDESDNTVTLTAHAVNGNDYYSRKFNVTVVRELTDEQIVTYDADRLSQYDNMIVDSKMQFPTTGKFGSTYKWETSDKSIIANDGTVTQTDKKQDVKFKVTITCNGETTTRDVTLTVAPVLTENLIIKGGIAASSANEAAPQENAGDNDYSTNWESLDIDESPYVIMDMGKLREVNRLYIADKAKSIKSITLESSKDKQEWTDVTIIKGIENENINMIEFETVNTRYIRAKFTADSTVSANELRLMFDKNASGGSSDVSTDITLPCGSTATENFILTTSLSDGTPVVWTSSNNAVIEISGSTANVYRATEDKEVTLKATINVGGQITEKTFKVVVKGTGVSNEGPAGNRPSGATTAGGIGGTTNVTSGTQTSVFNDLTTVPWAVEAINSLNAKGVVNGTSATTFHPTRNITREEFAAILYRGLGFDTAQVSGSFSDVSSAAWYYEPVMKLSSLGIITGIGNGKFGTGRTITRQDMAVMIYRAAIAANAQFTAGDVYFEDGKSIADYAKEAVGSLAGAQIINGVGNNRFNPAGNATRAEATVILSRIMNYIK